MDDDFLDDLDVDQALTEEFAIGACGWGLVEAVVRGGWAWPGLFHGQSNQPFGRRAGCAGGHKGPAVPPRGCFAVVPAPARPAQSLQNMFL
jgi:hypothetical protein